MRVNHVAAAILSLSSAILTVSCLQSPTAPPEAGSTGENAPAIEIEDDGDPFGGDPDLGGGIGSEPPASGVGSDPGSSGFGQPASPIQQAPGDPGEGESIGDSVRLAECLVLSVASAKVRALFCDTLCDRGAYARCRSHLNHSRTEWSNWCHFEFDD